MKTISSNFTENKIKELSNEFRQRRKYLNLSQINLAKLANLSQSIITKFENNKIDPTISTIYKIEHALQEQEAISSKKAKDIMEKRVTTITLSTSMLEALNIMKETDYSQLLIFERKELKGIVTEKKILDYLLEYGEIKDKKVKEIIEENPIIIPNNYLVSNLSYIFQNRKTLCVLVGNQKEIEGIITKSDLFK
jgi:predicted transcriptional regulator